MDDGYVVVVNYWSFNKVEVWKVEMEVVGYVF